MTEPLKTALRRNAIPGLPDSTLNECLLITAKRKAGKSYLQRLAFERALTLGLRSGWIDAMGIGWGVTVAGDPKNLEKPIGPGYDVVVFGGQHGHIPLSPSAGAALGLQLAKARFSWVLDLSGFKSKAERVRFMDEFMDVIYENTNSQLLLFVDEIDLWAPQTIIDKQGPVLKLLGTMDEIVRRGRIKGLVVWMATQRPAVVNLSIRSQAECLISMKTTAPQDIDAVMSWMKFHLKKESYQEQMGRLPALHRGQGIVYLTEPEISITEQQFPLIHTLDTMTPRKAGERPQSDKLGAKPDIAAITKELGDLEEKLKADDPAHLKAEVTRLTRELAAAAKAKPVVVKAPKVDAATIREQATAKGIEIGQRQAERQIRALKASIDKEIAAMQRKLSVILGAMARHAKTVEDGLTSLRASAAEIEGATGLKFPELEAELEKLAKVVTAGAPIPPALPTPERQKMTPPPRPTAVRDPAPADGVTRPQQKVLDALAWWAAAGHDQPTREQIAGIAGYSPSSGGFNNLIGQLNTSGWATIPQPGTLALTDAGAAIAHCDEAPTVEDLHARVQQILSGPQWKLLSTLIAAHPEAMTRDALGEATEYSPSSGGFNNLIGSLTTLRMVEKPQPGTVRAAEWLFEVR